FTISGNLQNDGTFTSGAGKYTFNTNGKEIKGGNAITFSGNVELSGAFVTITNTNPSGVTINGILDGTDVSSVFENKSILYYTSSASTQPMNTGVLKADYNPNTFYYSRSGDQTIKVPSVSYYNLRISGSGTKTLNGATSVDGDLTVSAGTLADGGSQITGVGGKTFAISSGAAYTTTRTSTPWFPTNMSESFDNNSTVNINGDASFTLSGIPTTYGHLTFDGASASRTKTLPASTAITVNGNLTINTNNTLADNGNIITVKGGVVNNATHSGVGKIYLNGGSGVHAISGGTSAFGNLELNDANGATFTGTGTTTINGTLTVTSGTMTLNAFTTGLVVSGTTTVGGTLATANITGTKTFGDVTISGGTWNSSVAEDFTITGNLQNDGTFTSGAGKYTFSTDTKEIKGGNTTTFSGNVEISGAITIFNTNTNPGGVTINGTLDGTAGGSTFENRGVLNYGNATQPMNTGILTAEFNPNTFDYSRSGAQTIRVPSISYYILKTSGGSGTKTANGAFRIASDLTIGTGTTLADNGSTIAVNGNITNNATHSGTGEIKLTGGSAQHTITGGGTFGNLELDDSQGLQLLSAATFNNSVILTTGIIDLNSYALNLASGAGIIRKDGTLSAAPTFLGNNDVTYTKTSATISPSFELPTDATNLRNLTLNGSGLDLSLNNSITVNGTLTMTTGTLNLNGKNITLCSTCNIASETNVNRIYGTTGYIQTTLNINNQSINPGNMVATINTAENLGSTTIKRGHAEQTGQGNKSVLRYYDIDPTNGGKEVSLTISYFDAENNGVTTNQKLYFSTNTGSTWREISPSSVSTGSNATSVNINPSWPYPNTRWTIGGGGAPLPIELLSFNGVYENKKVPLYWSTAAEINNDYFTIERSTDGEKFEIITNVKGAGNSNTILKYSVVDNNPPQGIVYYRLKQTDFDGAYKYSDIISVKVDMNVQGIEVSQPYFNGSNIKAVITNLSGTDLYVEIYNVLGAVYYSELFKPSQGYIDINVKVNNLSKGGVYFLRVFNGKEYVVKKFVY
ncbi:MAG: T9SS type A sorting domain-containing protein, partial [Bacteroidales bacterium]|nr:T9SS type A sorting domain-containing protein [Bacteroidales bacterium]